MRTLGVIVTPEIESACLERMRAGWFVAVEIADIVAKLGIPWAIDYRVAGRLIQRERKAGNIVRHGKGWIWR